MENSTVREMPANKTSTEALFVESITVTQSFFYRPAGRSEFQLALVRYMHTG